MAFSAGILRAENPDDRRPTRGPPPLESSDSSGGSATANTGCTMELLGSVGPETVVPQSQQGSAVEGSQTEVAFRRV